MLIPLLVRLTDSEVKAGDGMVPQVPYRIYYGRCVFKEIGAARLLIDQEALFPDLHVEPVYGNIQPSCQFWDAEQVGAMEPPAPRCGHFDPGAAPDLAHRDRENPVLAVGGAMPLIGKCRGDFIIGDAVSGKINDPVTHFRSAREFCNGVNLKFDFKIAYRATMPDDPDQSDIVLAAVEHNLFDEATQKLVLSPQC